jgi:alkanesulfonate monooxygenase SsuD/methylene tetrahydromethanopterin reductase-like flavin-dependent oxidoreductase (luciferase family)
LTADERWHRFDEAIQALRVLLDGDGAAFEGRFYSTGGLSLEPRPAQRPGPPIWVASWGSPPGLRRVARLGDGWLASAYNTTPDRFRDGLDRLADSFPNALATAWMYVTEDEAEGERMLADVLAPMLNRPVGELRDLSLPIGPAEVCAERVAAFARAGAQRLFVWPLRDEVAQLELFRERVVPLVG